MTDDPKMPSVVAYGGGVNSTAMLVGLRERGERPDAILFADTGGERPATYEHVELMRRWCEGVGFPDIVAVWDTFQGERETLEEHCLRLETLPSLAFGFRSCSKRFKREPQDRWTRKAFSGQRIIKLIGYDAGEAHRARRAPDVDGVFHFRYPLIEWGWTRKDCIEAITRAGLSVPGKSSCFFCPASKASEIKSLPCDLKARALAIEDAARPNLGSVVGLGRRFSWRALLESDAAQGDLFSPPESCECYDGDSND